MSCELITCCPSRISCCLFLITYGMYMVYWNSCLNVTRNIWHILPISCLVSHTGYGLAYVPYFIRYFYTYSSILSHLMRQATNLSLSEGGRQRAYISNLPYQQTWLDSLRDAVKAAKDREEMRVFQVCLCVYIHICMYACVHVCVCMHAHACACVCVCACVATCVCACVATCVCARVATPRLTVTPPGALRPQQMDPPSRPRPQGNQIMSFVGLFALNTVSGGGGGNEKGLCRPGCPFLSLGRSATLRVVVVVVERRRSRRRRALIKFEVEKDISHLGIQARGGGRRRSRGFNQRSDQHGEFRNHCRQVCKDASGEGSSPRSSPRDKRSAGTSMRGHAGEGS